MEDWIHTEGGHDRGIDVNNQNINYHTNYVFKPKWLNIQYLPKDTLDKAVLYLKGGDILSKDITRFILGRPDISDEEKQEEYVKLKHDLELKDRLRVKRPNWNTIDNSKLQLKELMYGN